MISQGNWERGIPWEVLALGMQLSYLLTGPRRIERKEEGWGGLCLTKDCQLL